MDSPDFRDALNFVRTQLPARLSDRTILDELVRAGLPGEYAGIRLVANLFESMGLFVRTGMMDRRIACQLWAGIVYDTWQVMRPLTATVRSRLSPGIWVNFEYMAVISKQYLDRFPTGEYPRGAPRMSVNDVPE